MSYLRLLPLLTLGVLPAMWAHASQWPTDPTTNLPVGVDPLDNRSPHSISDGQGGILIAWEYTGAPTIGGDIYVQRVSASGSALWGGNGIPATSAPSLQFDCSVAPDGAGGLIVAWLDYRSEVETDIYAQRVSSAGAVMWNPNGVPLCMAPNDQLEVQVVALEGGGAVAAWLDTRVDGVNADVYAQRVSPGGVVLWAQDGVAVCSHVANQEDLGLTPTSGATIIVWEDERNLGTSSEDIFAQRLAPNGVSSWAVDGIPVCSATNRQLDPQVIATAVGGAIVVWGDYRNGSSNSDVYAQCIDSLATAAWSGDGVPVCTATGSQLRPQIAADGSGGVVICWPDPRNGSSIYASRLSMSGQELWQLDGVPVCEAAGISDWPKIIPDATGGALIVWQDSRNNPSFFDVYAQRLDAGGSHVWTADGVPVSVAPDGQGRIAPVADGTGGLIVTWEDWRDGGYLAQRYQIYAQRINADGSLGGPTAIVPPPVSHALRILRTTPNPFSSSAEVAFDSEISGDVEVRIYSVAGKLVFRDSVRATLGENRYVLRSGAGDDRQLASGVYFLRLQTRGANAVSKLVVAR